MIIRARRTTVSRIGGVTGASMPSCRDAGGLSSGVGNTNSPTLPLTASARSSAAGDAEGAASANGRHTEVAVQDDHREREMRQLFNLVKPPDSGRGDVDAVLEMEDDAGAELTLQFELKSSTKGKASISTVRDFGLHYLEKWREMHWLFGIYDRRSGGDLELRYCLYGSPHMMKPWFDQMAAYIRPDVALGVTAPALITDATLSMIMGDADRFEAVDAKALAKKQLSAEQYRARADLPGGAFSRSAMLELLRDRAAYLIARGSTLNNPHIPASFFAGWDPITRDHAATLRALVRRALETPLDPVLDLSGRTDVLGGDDRA